ncbi:hypothetical protein A2125_02325 [Candidatus Woesebacteria bacterium GWB1_43_5]|uniref:DUF3105 domain-containing protein n=1 Tax=Candidatus Woesebacteria bacterium GWB1_43_5 TaxID=1802474 RepID=A0A1F7WTM4_9BACT|nr:MAG: hypothetical protein A2125_02325 [Candidatus Woesebacteria bacterium GWB1_43_5]
MDEDNRPPTRRERRAQAKGEKKEGERKSGVLKKLLFAAIGLVSLGVVGYWLYGQASKPVAGEAVANQGRDHVTDIFGIEYNSNPPTSGKHFPMWAKKGMYDRLISDGYLIHSLEHGYVIVSYDCSNLATSYSLLATALAHDEPTQQSTDSGQLLMHMKLTPSTTMSAFSPENAPEVEIPLPEEFNSDACKNLQNDLEKLVNYRERVIVVPKINMETQLAITAWRRILKLDNFDQGKLEEFISAFHNKGPERTIE